MDTNTKAPNIQSLNIPTVRARRRARLAAVAAALLIPLTSLAAAAQTAAPVYNPSAGTPVVRPGFGGQTDVWLSLQLDPRYTAGDSRPVSGEVANRSYQRYLDSFAHPIPDHFDRETFKGGSSGSN